MEENELRLGGFPLSGIIRKVRRALRLSQRELAELVGLAPSSLAALETGTSIPRLETLIKVLAAAEFQLTVVDKNRRLVLPLLVWGNVADLADRRFPAHLDTILDPEFGEWWADVYGLARPPETFRRSRRIRDQQRRVTRWQVRKAQFRESPKPIDPNQLPDAGRLENGWDQTPAVDP